LLLDRREEAVQVNVQEAEAIGLEVLGQTWSSELVELVLYSPFICRQGGNLLGIEITFDDGVVSTWRSRQLKRPRTLPATWRSFTPKDKREDPRFAKKRGSDKSADSSSTDLNDKPLIWRDQVTPGRSSLRRGRWRRSGRAVRGPGTELRRRPWRRGCRPCRGPR
jgi:hypothetical protein